MKSRANGLKHGLCSSVVVAEDLELVSGRISDWYFTLKPQNDYHMWLVEKIAVCSIRIDRAERMERRYRDRRSLKAELDWEDDRRLEVENLGAKIGLRPAQIVEELRRSPVGCDWLISRWSMLAHAADSKPWTSDQTTLALNLLGTPYEFREVDGEAGQKLGDILDTHGHVSESSEGQAALARREIDHLIERRERVSEIDEVDRSLVEADLFDESNPELKNLRRYDGRLQNQLRWCLKELRYISPHFKPDAELTLRMVTNFNAPAAEEPAPAPAPDPKTPAKPKAYGNWDITSFHPPFSLEPHEIPTDGSRPDLFQILLARQEELDKQKEKRREARREKVQKMRA